MEKEFWKILNEKFNKDNWQKIDYYILQSYLRSGQSIVIIDVSEKRNDEYFEHNNLEYIHTPFKNIITDMDKLTIEKNKTICCICEQGAKSAVAAQFLRFYGIDACFLVGGITEIKKITK